MNGRDSGIAAAAAGKGSLLDSCLGALDLLLHLAENVPVLMSPYANGISDLVLGSSGGCENPRGAYFFDIHGVHWIN